MLHEGRTLRFWPHFLSSFPLPPLPLFFSLLLPSFFLSLPSLPLSPLLPPPHPVSCVGIIESELFLLLSLYTPCLLPYLLHPDGTLSLWDSEPKLTLSSLNCFWSQQQEGNQDRFETRRETLVPSIFLTVSSCAGHAFGICFVGRNYHVILEGRGVKPGEELGEERTRQRGKGLLPFLAFSLLSLTWLPCLPCTECDHASKHCTFISHGMKIEITHLWKGCICDREIK